MKGWITNEKYSQTEEREWRTTKLGWWSQSGCLPISELGTWPMTRQKLHWSLKNRASVCPSLGVLLDMAQYLTVILIFAGWGNMDKMNQKRSGGFPNLSGKKRQTEAKHQALLFRLYFAHLLRPGNSIWGTDPPHSTAWKGWYLDIPGLVNQQKAIENGPVEIADLPMKNSDFP